LKYKLINTNRAQTQGNKSSKASTGQASTSSTQHSSYTAYITQSLMRRLGRSLTPELIARIGVRWHNAVNKGVIAALIRADMIVVDMAGDTRNSSTTSKSLYLA